MGADGGRKLQPVIRGDEGQARRERHGRAALKTAKCRTSDREQYERYKAVLGRDSPKTFAKFQELKYTTPEKWENEKAYYKYRLKYPDSRREYFDIGERLKQADISIGVPLPPVVKRAYILPEGKKDPYHVMHRMKERAITDDELRSFVTDAKVMFIQWGGQRQLFFGEQGVSVITRSGDDWIYKTAWKNTDYDEQFEKVLEVVKDVGL